MAFALTDWQWDLLPLIAAIAAAGIQRSWRSLRGRKVASWPITYGEILGASSETKNKYVFLTARYRYRIDNEPYSGAFKKILEEEDEAERWADALRGKQVTVHYDPQKPSRSELLASDLEPIVRAFGASHVAPPQPVEATPWWKRFTVEVGLVLAITGFAVCAVELISEKMGKPFLSRGAYELLRTGVFIFPLLTLRGNIEGTKRSLRALPEWMKYLGFVAIFYAFFAAIPFFSHGHGIRSNRDVTYLMAAYFGVVEVLYARLRAEPRQEDYLLRGLNGT